MTLTPFASLFLAIQQRLSTLIPTLRWIDQDLGQLEQERPPVTYPCALIDFANWSYEDLSQGIQMAQGSVIIRLAWDVWSHTNNATPTIYKEKALSFYDLEWQIYQALHSWAPHKHGYLLREAVSTEGREDNLRVRSIRFSCSFEDYKAATLYQTGRLPPPEIETRINH